MARLHDERWMREHADEWAGADLITPEQAAALVHFEAGREVAGEDLTAGALGAAGGGRGVSPWAEATAYVGSVLALLAGALAMATSWEQAPFVVRVVSGLLVGVLGLVGGQIVGRLTDPGAARLSGFLRVVGAAGAAFSVGVATHELGSPDWAVALAIAVTLSAIGWPLWRNRDRPLQMLTTVAGAVAGGVAVAIAIEPAPWMVGLVAWTAGAAFGVAALTERVRPPVYAALVGALAMLLGASTAWELLGEAGVLVVVATAALLVVVGISERCVPVLVVGVLGLMQSTTQMLATIARGPVALLVVLVAGVTMVVVVLTRVGRVPPSSSAPE